MFEENNDNNIQNEDEFTSIDTLDAEKAEKATVNVEADNDPLAGKSPEQLREMYRNSQAFIKKQESEVAFARQLARDVVSRNDKSSTPTPNQQSGQDEVTDTDFLIDPKKAVDRAVANHPAVKQAEVNNAESRKLAAQQKLLRDHPDTLELINDSEFQEFLSNRPQKARLLKLADDTADADLASDVISDFKATRKQKVDTTKVVLDDARKNDLSAAKVSTGRGKGSNKPIYRSADIRALMTRDPKKYEAMYFEIMEAYAEDRVR